MELTVKEAMEFLKVSKDTWKKADKGQLFNRVGFKLIGVSKRGRNNFYIVEEVKTSVSAAKRELFFNYDIRVAEERLPFLIGMIMAVSNEIDSYINMKNLAYDLDISESTAYRWRSKLEEANIIRLGRKDLVVKYYSPYEQEIGTQEDWEEWKTFLEVSGGTENYQEKMAFFQQQKGYFVYRGSSISSNGLYNNLFEIIKEANKELEGAA